MGFVCIMQPLSGYLGREGASRKSEWVSHTGEAVKVFEALKQACMTASILLFADYTKPFMLETDVSKDRLGWCCHRSRKIGSTTPLPMAAEP